MLLATKSSAVTTGRILVVDDDRQIGLICARALALDEHAVKTTTSATVALQLLKEEPFDLLLTDILMPDVSGLDLVLQAREQDPTLGVVVMTADASYEHMAAALGQGVADFLPKPFRMEQLRLTVHRALQRQRLVHENVQLQTLVHLLETGQRFSASLDPRQIAATILEAICSTIGIACVHVSVLEGEALVDSGARHTGECLIQAAVESNDRPSGVRLMQVPLNAAGERIGEITIAVDNNTMMRPDLDPAVQMLASQAAAALHNARLYAALAELDRQKSEFITIASHELRTPLSVILGYSSMLRDKLVDRQHEFIDQVVDAGLRINDIVDDLINLRELELGETVLKLSEVHLQQLVGAAVMELQVLAEAGGVRLRLLCVRQPLVLQADREKLMMALAHLIANAIRFTPEGGEVTVVCGRQKPENGGNIVVAVRDTGIGIPSHQMQRIFDRFYQVAESRTREQGGLGLGLAIARGFVELHGGRIAVRSVLGSGSLFQMILPAAYLVVASVEATTTCPGYPERAGHHDSVTSPILMHA
jgi:signal transduction histidine kinase